uniref:C2 domain-containing protein n=1 Tax=Picea sitchensis TaxID=3332 RepID=A9NPU3_PICSI|nr:unknown [Picea sitchensis]
MKERRKREGQRQPKKRAIEVRIISAQDLEDVKLIGKMRCYAVLYIDPEHKASTRIDENGGINPFWNELLVLQADDELLSQNMAAVNVDIYARGHMRDKLVGTSRILISQVLKGGDAANLYDNPIGCMPVLVRRPSGRPQGILNIWIPPAGKFLLRRSSLSFSRVDCDEQDNVKERENGLKSEAGGRARADEHSPQDVIVNGYH